MHDRNRYVQGFDILTYHRSYTNLIVQMSLLPYKTKVIITTSNKPYLPLSKPTIVDGHYAVKTDGTENHLIDATYGSDAVPIHLR